MSLEVIAVLFYRTRFESPYGEVAVEALSHEEAIQASELGVVLNRPAVAESSVQSRLDQSLFVDGREDPGDGLTGERTLEPGVFHAL